MEVAPVPPGPSLLLFEASRQALGDSGNVGPILTGGTGSGAGVQESPGTTYWNIPPPTGPSLLRSTDRKLPGCTKEADRAMKDLWKAVLTSRLPQATTLPRESSTGHCTCALETSHGGLRHYAV